MALYLTSKEYPQYNAPLAGVQGAVTGLLSAWAANQTKYFSFSLRNAALVFCGTYVLTELMLRTTRFAIDLAVKDYKMKSNVVPKPLKNALTIATASFLTTKVMEEAGLILGLSKLVKIPGYAATTLFLGVHLYNYANLLAKEESRKKAANDGTWEYVVVQKDGYGSGKFQYFDDTTSATAVQSSIQAHRTRNDRSGGGMLYALEDSTVWRDGQQIGVLGRDLRLAGNSMVYRGNTLVGTLANN